MEGKSQGPGFGRREDRLDVRLAEGRLGADDVARLGAALAERDARADEGEELAREASPAALARRARDATAALARHAAQTGLGGPALEALADRQALELASRVGAFLDRHEAGRVRAVHGDLRCPTSALDAAGRLRLAPAPQRARDVAEPLARLGVDVAARGAALHAERLLAAYVERSDDFALYRVVDWYQRHQACRLAARAAHAEEHGAPDPDDVAPPSAHALAQVALSAGARSLVPPALVITNGAVASGKSTLAEALARHLGAPRVNGDAVRAAVLGAVQAVHESAWERAFEPGFEERVYASALRRAGDALASGRTAVVDACFPTRHEREAAAALARGHGVPLRLVRCRPAPEVLHARLAERDASAHGGETPWKVLAERLAERAEPREADEPGREIQVDTGRPLAECLEAVVAELPTAPEGPAT